MDRCASLALAPALRMTWASPSEMPKAAAGSMRASMHVTRREGSHQYGGSRCSLRLLARSFARSLFRVAKSRDLTDEVFLRRRESEVALIERAGVLGVLLDEILLDFGCHGTGMYYVFLSFFLFLYRYLTGRDG